jgi:hypothetical protein
MKKLLFISMFIWGTAEAQSKLYLRGDSIQMERSGGNSELILLNGSRNVNRGVLTNMGGGRTRFLPIDSFAVGATLSNIGTGFDLAQANTSNVKRLAFANGLTGDSATSQTVTARLGGTLTENTTIIGGRRKMSFTFDSLSQGAAFKLYSGSLVAGTGDSTRLFSAIMTGLNNFNTRTTTAAYIENTHTGGGGISPSRPTGLHIKVGDSAYLGLQVPVGMRLDFFNQGVDESVGFILNQINGGNPSGTPGMSKALEINTSGKANSSRAATRMLNSSTYSGSSYVQNWTLDVNTSGSNTGHNVSILARASNGSKNFAFKATAGYSTFLTAGDSINAIVGIGASTTARPSLNIQEGTPPTSPIDGDMWHYADSLYFRAGGVTYNLTHLNEGGGDTDDQTFQETLDESSTLNKANTIDQDGFLMQWLGPNRFYDSSATQVSLRDFNAGTDYTWYTPILGDTAGNVQMNVVDGFKVSMTDGTETHSLQVNGNGIFAEGLKFEDNDALRAVVIDTLTGEIRTAALGAVSGIDDVLAVGQSLSATRTINLNGNPLSISNGFDANSFSPTSFSSQYFESGFTHSTTLTNYKDYFQALTASSGNTSQALIETHKDYYARMYVTTPSATSYARVDDDQIELNTTNLKFTGRVFNDAPSLRGLALDTTNGYVYTVPIGSGSSVSFGSDNQIPYTNSGGTDFDYSSGFTFDGTTLGLPQDINFNGGSYYLSSYAGGTRLSLQGGTGSGSQTTFKLLSPDATDSLLARADNGGGHLIDRSGDLTIRRSNTTQLTFGTSTITSAISFLPRTGATGAGSAPIKYTSGTLMTTAEAGAQEYNGDHFLTKANNVRYAVGGSLHNNVTSVAVTGSSAENLMSYTLPAGALSTNGSYIEVTAVFYCVTVGENFKIAFGSTNVVDFTVGSVGTYYVTGTITRTGATTQEARFNVGGAESAALITSPTETLSNAIVVKGVGEGIGAGDITQFQLNVKYYGN